jgi:hypothetical protein
MTLSRRELGKLLLTVPAAGVLANDTLAAMLAAKPDSKWAGVQIGMNVPYNFGMRTMPVDEVIAKTAQLGVSAVELRSQPIELFLGVPQAVLEPGRDKAAQQQAAQDLRKWRVSSDPAKAAAVRKKFDDAGIKTDIIKYDGIYDFSDAELDYAFNLAKAMGARAISCELDVDGSKRVGQFADKHKIWVGYHGHTKASPAMWEQSFGYARYNGANLDIGHFVAGDFGSPLPFLKAHHDRITHIHIKDRKAHEGENTPFGEGETPIKEVLQTLRDNKWPIQATIEFEYKVPAGSDRMAEMAKALEYCKTALLSKT